METRKVKFKRTIIATSKNHFEGEVLPFRRTCERGKVYELPEHAALYQVRKGNAELVSEGKVSNVKEEYQRSGKWKVIN